MTAVEEKVRSSAHCVGLRAPAPLIRAIENALVAAAPSHDLVKSLKAVQVHFDGTHLELQSTDRYLALFEQVAGVDDAEDAPTSEPFKLLLPIDACKQALTFLKGLEKRHLVTITWKPDSDRDWSTGTLLLASYENTISLTVLDLGDAPKLRGLVPQDRVATEVTGFRHSLLKAVGKIKAEFKDPIVRITLAGPSKIVRVDWPEERRTLLVMSARIREDVTDWGVPGL